jgi:hypothetical protein
LRERERERKRESRERERERERERVFAIYIYIYIHGSNPERGGGGCKPQGRLDQNGAFERESALNLLQRVAAAAAQ